MSMFERCSRNLSEYRRAGRVLATLALMVMVAGCNDASEKEAPSSLVGEVAFAHVFVNPAEDLKRAVQLVPSNSLPGIWYLVRQNGTVLLFSEDPAEPGYLVALDIADERLDLLTDESGLMSMALHPSGDFAFLVYTAVTNSHSGPFDSRLSRFDVLDDGTLDAESEVVFLDIEQPKFSHSGNHVVFGEDGLLYYSVGDGGCCGDPFDQAQDTTTLSG
ncbi:PQQ-dependent sugar dehydrogenase, partial [Myxococcota bacterium]|nr:PQQ-dependent sugar dehydrogenase [Myxococcota bacterium]